MSEVPVAAPAPASTPATFPGKTLGIVGLILAIFFNLIGLIVSIIAFNQSKSAGFKNTPAKAGIIVGAALLVLGIIIAVVGGIASAALVGNAIDQACSGQAAGVYELTDGSTITCP